MMRNSTQVPEVKFFRKTGLILVPLLLAVPYVPSEDVVHSSLAWVTVLASLAEVIYARLYPALTIGATGILIRPPLGMRTRRIDAVSLAAWTHAEAWIGFQSMRGTTLRFELRQLREPDRTRLITYLQSSGLREDLPGSSLHTSVEKYARRIRYFRWGGIGIVIAAMVVLIAWYVSWR